MRGECCDGWEKVLDFRNQLCLLSFNKGEIMARLNGPGSSKTYNHNASDLQKSRRF
jgi:hypothetical protein